MSILTVQNSIITRLESVITDLKIEAFPDSVDEYRLKHPKGALLVQYTGSRLASPTCDDVIQQSENLQFALTLLVKNLYGTSGAYTYIDSAKAGLTGYRLANNLGKAYFADIKFLDEKGGTWIYGLNLVVPSEIYG